MAKQTRSTKAAGAGAIEGKARRREMARLERARQKVESALKDARAELGRRHRQVTKAEAGILALEARLAKAVAAHMGSSASVPATAESAVGTVKSAVAKRARKAAAKPVAHKVAARTAAKPAAASTMKPAAKATATKPVGKKPAATKPAAKTTTKPAAKATATKPAARTTTPRRPATTRSTGRGATRPRSRRSPQAGADGGGSTPG